MRPSRRIQILEFQQLTPTTLRAPPQRSGKEDTFVGDFRESTDRAGLPTGVESGCSNDIRQFPHGRLRLTGAEDPDYRVPDS